MSNQVLVIAEHIKGGVEDITFELLGKGRELADKIGGPLEVVLLGHDQKGLASQFGIADKVIYSDHPNLAEFNPEAYCKTISEIVAARQPELVMVANTSMGMDIAAGVSVNQDLSLVAYANDLNYENGSLSVVSQLYGGKVNVESQFESNQYMVSVIAGSFKADAGRAEGNPEIEEVSAPDLDNLKVQFIKLIEPEGGDVDITQHDVLVSVGRGIQSDENLPMAVELAEKLGGVLSCSRPIVDNKWLGKTRQVGKSGLKVKPKLYLALGISGAPEHIEGMKEAELVIAVNTDPNAPIFDYSHYGVEADLFDLIPALSAKL